MSDRESSTPGYSFPKIVDTGEGNRIQVGHSNTFLTLTMPGDASESDLPTVSGPEESPDATTAPLDVDVVIAGKGGTLQRGNSNLIVVAKKEGASTRETVSDTIAEGGSTRETVADTSLEPTTEAVQFEGSLVTDADEEIQPDSTPPQAMVLPPSTNQLSQINKIQQTKVKQVDSSFTCMNIDPTEPEVDTQSEDFNDNAEWETAEPHSTVFVDGDSEPVQFQQVTGQYLRTTGPNSVTVDIEVYRNFLEEANREETLPGFQSPVRVLHLLWTGVPELAKCTRVSWRLTLHSYTISLENEVLRLMASDMFRPLRILANRAYANYRAYLNLVLRGPLMFVFLYQDAVTATSMVDDRNAVKSLFRHMMNNLGKSDVDFTLEAIPSPEAAGVLQPQRTVPAESLKGTDIEAKVQSLETEVASVKTTLEQLVSLLISRVLPPESTQSTLAHSIQKVLDKADLSKKPGQLQTSKADHKSSAEITQKHPENDSQKSAGAIAGPVLDSMSSEKSRSIGGEKGVSRPEPKRSTRSQKFFVEAERLLSSLNVASEGRSATNKELRRLTEAVAEALVDDDPPPPRAKSMDTLLCLDVSDSIGVDGVAEVKRIAHNFVDGIQEMAELHNLEENLALISMGGGARVAQQLTNDYTLIKDAIDSLEVGGLSPIFETLSVCVAALKGRGGVLSVGGAHNIRPRIIFITDGKATNDAQERGPDIPSTDHNTKIQLIRLVGQFSPKQHSSRPHPIVWVPAGDADRNFLQSLAKLGSGEVVDGDQIKSLCSYLRIQEIIGKLYICVKNNATKFDQDETEAYLGALAGDMTQEQKDEVLKIVKHKIENKEVLNPDSEPNGYDNVHEVPGLPPLGTRVVRGPNWRYGDQDAEGPGTIINHSSEDKLLWVLWDFSTIVCRYRFDRNGKYDVTTVEDLPRTLMSDELIEIGVKVIRGPDWTYGDIDGGPGGVGVVIRRRQDGKVKVRWQTGEIKSCKFGYDGKFDLQICEGDPPKAPPRTSPSTPKQPDDVSPEKPHVLWQKKDDMEQWRLYRRDEIDKLNVEFAKKPTGSCLLNKDGQNRRVYFNTMTERDLGRDVKREVRRKAVNDEELQELISMEMAIGDGYTWST